MAEELTRASSRQPKNCACCLIAPGVSAQAFDNEFSNTFQKLSKHLTAYVSSNDRALLMSHWTNGHRRLGRKANVLVPLEQRTGQYEFEEALELLDLQAKGARNISIVDATPINHIQNLHHFFTDSPVFFDDLLSAFVTTRRHRGQTSLSCSHAIGGGQTIGFYGTTVLS